MCSVESAWTDQGMVKVGQYAVMRSDDTPCKIVKIETIHGSGTVLVIEDGTDTRRIKPSDIVVGEIF